MIMDKFPPATPEAIIPLVFDFSEFAGTGVTIAQIKSVSVVALKELDATPESRIYGAANIEDGQSVVQWWRYPVLGEVYEITCAVQLSDAREWSKTARLLCLKT